ncbi:MAG: hypothetical protein ACLFV5_05305 [Anaerolineales bacterium]
MYAAEFVTKIREGVIEIPEKYRQYFKDNVKVILLAEEEVVEGGKEDMIATLMEHPLHVSDFTPLTREEAHARS